MPYKALEGPYQALLIAVVHVKASCVFNQRQDLLHNAHMGLYTALI